jgi:superfamily II DNA or RNA helicase
MPASLRDYQTQALVFIATRGWGRIALATNAGKGAIISLCAEAGAALQRPVLILCDEIAVLDALSKEIPEWIGVEPALVRQGIQDPPSTALITLAMVPTLRRRITPPSVGERIQTITQLLTTTVPPGSPEYAELLLEIHQLKDVVDKPKTAKGRAAAAAKPGPPSVENQKWLAWLNTIQMVLLDEADKATAATWQELLAVLPNTLWRVGFSGTFPDPGTIDDLTLEETLGPVLIQVKNKQLIDRKISAHAEVHLHAFRSVLPPLPLDWNTRLPTQQRLWVFEECVMRNAARHAFIHSLLLADDLNAIIVSRVEHGQQLEAVLPSCRFLDGSVDPRIRIEVLDAYARGEFQNLITTKILDRGSNRLGVAVGLLFASGEGSVRQSLQRIGRGLRRTGGKEFLRLTDIMDSGHPYLIAAARRRVQLYNSEQFQIRTHGIQTANRQGTNA